MSRPFAYPLALVGVITSAVLLSARGSADERDLFPTKIGCSWLYEGKVGTAPQAMRASIITTSADSKGATVKMAWTVNGIDSSMEGYYLTASGLVRTRMGPQGKTVLSPGLPVLKFPLKAGAKWIWQGVQRNDKETHPATATVTAIGQEKVKTGAGEFTAWHIKMTVKSINLKRPEEQTVDMWYAPKVGLVQQQISVPAKMGPIVQVTAKLGKYSVH